MESSIVFVNVYESLNSSLNGLIFSQKLHLRNILSNLLKGSIIPSHFSQNSTKFKSLLFFFHIFRVLILL